MNAPHLHQGKMNNKEMKQDRKENVRCTFGLRYQMKRWLYSVHFLCFLPTGGQAQKEKPQNMHWN